MDAHRLAEIDAVVVDEALGLVAAVRPFGDRGAHLGFAELEQPLAAGLDLVAAVFRQQLVDALLGQPAGAELAADVAQHQLGRAAVGGDQPLDVGVLADAWSGSAPPAGAGPR